jgi:hypothetical protein
MVLELWCVTSCIESGSPITYWNGKCFTIPADPNIILYPTFELAQKKKKNLLEVWGMTDGPKISIKSMRIYIGQAKLIEEDL